MNKSFLQTKVAYIKPSVELFYTCVEQGFAATDKPDDDGTYGEGGRGW